MIIYPHSKILSGLIKPKGWIITPNMFWAVILFIYFLALTT